MAKEPMGTQYAVGIILTFIVLGFGLILTRGILADPAWKSSYGMSADMMVLAVWAGIIPFTSPSPKHNDWFLY